MELKIRSVNDVLTYIHRHESLLGFRPTAVGVTVVALEAIKDELKGCRTYSERSNEETPSSSLVEIYIDYVRVIYSPHTR